MTETVIDLSTEAGGGLWQTLLVTVIILVALAYLVHSFWAKQKRLRAGGGCGTCASCSSGNSCPIQSQMHFPPPTNTPSHATSEKP
ncbi:FeoB-associated Cys-rich membrane protein [Celeribacter persicus]|uniref:Attachment p12 family protein n=1 Tax=Celeribacter persicus TaxID=1651082 RepID=A0A2T5HJZ3_9RHOB|nr:FeoB-associated Cys-rich membrane protein [Celeribacter persicus]PTQ71898.1 attachment p12 family protein [Celeribacter persicus]